MKRDRKDWFKIVNKHYEVVDSQCLSVYSRSSLNLHYRIVPSFSRFLMTAARMVLLLSTILIRSCNIPQWSSNHNRKYHVKIHVHYDHHQNYMKKCVQNAYKNICQFLSPIELLICNRLFVSICNDWPLASWIRFQ